MRIFLGDGSPLPKLTSLHDHYETITGGDDLMLSLLALAQVLTAEPGVSFDESRIIQP
ncbi:MAG: hypothetical protein HC888_01240 [Candidatus Competibacteraceae bacterium]|nr:hypothetical protein [Candidatus Competibacteraceae bacterium]